MRFLWCGLPDNSVILWSFFVVLGIFFSLGGPVKNRICLRCSYANYRLVFLQNLDGRGDFFIIHNFCLRKACFRAIFFDFIILYGFYFKRSFQW